MKQIFSIKTLLLFSGLLLLATSCRRKDSIPPSGPLPEVPLLKRIDKDTDNYLHLEYAGNAITKLDLVEDRFPLNYRFTYSNEGKPVEAILWGVYKYRFFYRNKILNRVEYYNNLTTTEADGYMTFTYDNSNRLCLTTGYYTNGDNSYLENAKTAYAYYPNGDVKSMTDSTLSPLPYRFVLEKRSVYEYDTKSNPLKAANEVFYALNLNHTPHNITRETVYDENDRLQETKTCQFEYNTNSLPAKAVETTTAPGKPAIIRNVTYTY